MKPIPIEGGTCPMMPIGYNYKNDVCEGGRFPVGTPLPTDHFRSPQLQTVISISTDWSYFFLLDKSWDGMVIRERYTHTGRGSNCMSGTGCRQPLYVDAEAPRRGWMKFTFEFEFFTGQIVD